MGTVGTQVRRADALKNIAAILDAATAALARDPDASINDIAQAAGVGRVTLYGHFGSRAALLSAVVALIHYGVVLREEAFLERRFGAPYKAYQSRVRRWM